MKCQLLPRCFQVSWWLLWCSSDCRTYAIVLRFRPGPVFVLLCLWEILAYNEIRLQVCHGEWALIPTHIGTSNAATKCGLQDLSICTWGHLTEEGTGSFRRAHKIIMTHAARSVHALSRTCTPQLSVCMYTSSDLWGYGMVHRHGGREESRKARLFVRFWPFFLGRQEQRITTPVCPDLDHLQEWPKLE